MANGVPYNSVSELTAASGYRTGLNFAPGGVAFDDPDSLALDGSGNVFVANDPYPGSVSELTAASGYAAGLNFLRRARCLNIHNRWRWTAPATFL